MFPITITQKNRTQAYFIHFKLTGDDIVSNGIIYFPKKFSENYKQTRWSSVIEWTNEWTLEQIMKTVTNEWILNDNKLSVKNKVVTTRNDTIKTIFLKWV